MVSLTDIFQNTEKKSIMNTEIISKEVINKIERDLGIIFKLDEGIGYSQLLQVLLFDQNYKFCKDIMYKYLEYYEANERNIIIRFLNIINQPDLPNEYKEYLISFLYDCPFIKHFDMLDNGYYIQTKTGDIEAYKLSEVTENMKLRELLYKYDLSGFCHQAAELFHQLLPDCQIITSQLACLFKGFYYHTYFENEDMTIDLSSNTLYTNSSFNRYYKPYELLRIPSNLLEQCYKNIPKEQNDEDKGLSKVLKLALLNYKKSTSL